jgi:deoxycytidylate deaminase
MSQVFKRMFDIYVDTEWFDNLDISEEEYLEKEFNSYLIENVKGKLFMIQHLVDRNFIGKTYIKEYYIQWIFRNLLEKFGKTFDTHFEPFIQYLISLRDKITNIYKIKEKELKESKEYKMKFVMDQLKKQFLIQEERRLALEKIQLQEMKKREKENSKKSYYTNKLPCDNCDKLISRSNMALHKNTITCKNFVKPINLDICSVIEEKEEEEVEKEIRMFVCDCGAKPMAYSNKSNHQKGKKCKTLRGIS